ncbi:alpha/beta fold hydrolase [Solirubrobacter soli]|uniref:alpha/beta fold hydrolase n=1 Tax=Solirubrobacter soli TaxID=363832 RepID=UPI00042050C4|nr:alpha/beta hydrolase [Solirubrobacter soli]
MTIVLLHGFADSPHTWDLMRPYLGDVLTPALPGHLGGPPLPRDLDLVGWLEGFLDDAGLERAHLVGNSLGGYLALAAAARGRAETVVALAPAGGSDHAETLDRQERGVIPLSDFTTRELEDDVKHWLGASFRACDRLPLIANAREHGWPLDLAKVRCPVRILWGMEDKLLRWPEDAERYRRGLDAEWIELDGVGHAPQLDIPLETAQLISGFVDEWSVRPMWCSRQ